MLDAAHLRDLLVASDAGLGRLRQATRATLTGLVSAGVLHAIARALDQPTSVGLVGINMALMGTVVVNDPTPRDQRITSALVPLVASAALIAGTLAAPHAWLRDGLFLAVVFVAVLVRRFGPRGLALGMIAFLAYFSSLFFQASPAQLPLMIAGIFVAAALAFAVRYGLLRERPGALLRQRRVALRRTLAVLLHHLAAAAAAGRASPGRERRVRRALGAVNESALAIDELLERVEPGALPPELSPLRAHVFALELAIEGVAAAVQAALEGAASPASARLALAQALDGARVLVRGGPAATGERAAALLADLDAALVGAEAPALLGVREALAELLDAALRTPPPLPPPVAAAPPPGPRESTLRPALQATLAAALALVAGQMASSTRGSWAVLAAFMVFTRASTLAAMLVRAWQRVLGTVLGVLVGVLVAHAVQGRVELELAVVFACMFVAYYTLQVAYAWTVASFTTLLAALYSLLGRFTPDLLVLRVVETLIGAGVGALVAALVFPTHTRDRLRDAMIEALRALAEHLGRLPAAAADRPALLSAARTLDRRLRDIRTDVQRAAWTPALRHTRELARIYFAFAAVFFHARPLVAADWSALAGEGPSTLLARLSADARALADALAGGGEPALETAAPHITALRQGLPDAQARLRGASSPAAALSWLARLDEALRALARVVVETGLARPASLAPRS